MNHVSVDAPAKDIIRAVRDIFSDPGHWVKRTNVRGDAMCLAYAVLAVTQTETTQFGSEAALSKVASALGFSTVHDMVVFNDSNLTTHAVLLERLDRVLHAEANA